MKDLDLPDRRHLEAAQGWLELGNCQEANAELENITPELRAHPGVLRVRWEVYANAGKWEGAVEIGRALSKSAPKFPFGWIKAAQALHELKRTAEAREVLLRAADKFKDWNVFYDLACYACQLGNLIEAYGWLEKTFDLNPEARLMALKDADLEPLWADIGEV